MVKHMYKTRKNKSHGGMKNKSRKSHGGMKSKSRKSHGGMKHKAHHKSKTHGGMKHKTYHKSKTHGGMKHKTNHRSKTHGGMGVVNTAAVPAGLYLAQKHLQRNQRPYHKRKRSGGSSSGLMSKMKSLLN